MNSRLRYLQSLPFYLSVTLASAFVLPIAVVAECTVRSGRSLFTCSIDETRSLSVVKEFLGSGKRRYVLLVKELPGDTTCDLIATKQKQSENGVETFLFSRGLTLILSPKGRFFRGALRGVATPLLEAYVNVKGKVSLNRLACVRQHREES